MRTFLKFLTILMIFAFFIMPVYAEKPKQVTVTNTPLQVQGDVSVNGNVEVTNTPLPVTVTNGDLISRQPRLVYQSIDIPDGHSSVFHNVIAIDENELFVIETVSLQVDLPDDQNVVNARIEIWDVVREDETYFHLPLSLQGIRPSESRKFFSACQNMRIYAGSTDSNFAVKCHVERNDTRGAGEVKLALSGYFLPADSPSLAP